MEDAGWDAGRRRPACTTTPRCSGCCAFAATQVVPRLARHDRRARRRAARPRRRLRPGRAVRLAAARAGQRAADRPQLLHRRPARGARRGWPGRPAQAMADSLVQRYLDETGAYPESVGLSVWGTSAMRTSGDDIAEVLALLGVRPEWDEASRRVQRPARRTARGARPPAHRRDRADLRLLPRRLPARGGDARRRRTAGGRARRAARPELRPRPRPGRPRRARRRAPGDDADLRLQARVVRRRHPAADRVRHAGATTRTWPRSTRPGAASPTAATSTARRPPTTCAPTTGGSRSRPRTSTPASTTSPTPTTTSSTTAAWSRPCAR